jgi:hypothetical protein
MMYIIAVRRDSLPQMGLGWSEPLASIEGLEVVGDATPFRLRVEATEAAIEIARQQFSEYCHIEEIRPRYVLAGS